jgi:pSer/pThr/pTyr-binding forkhead associated (FHA) protein
VEDMGSTNGTFVNGRKAVGATPLRRGDTVRIGSTTFRYEE